jgi:hypothetical protein
LRVRKEMRKMKRILIGILLAALPLWAGCVSQKFHYTATYDEVYPFEVDQTGHFDVAKLITPEDVNRALDIPGDAKIDELQIEALAVRVVILPGNQATLVSVSGSIADDQGNHNIWNGYPIPLAGVNVPFIGLNSLIETGVSRLRSKLLGYATRLNTTFCGLHVTGDTVPTDRRMHFRIDLRVRATIKYHRCLKVPREVFDGEKCTD